METTPITTKQQEGLEPHGDKKGKKSAGDEK